MQFMNWSHYNLFFANRANVYQAVETDIAITTTALQIIYFRYSTTRQAFHLSEFSFYLIFHLFHSEPINIYPTAIIFEFRTTAV